MHHKEGARTFPILGVAAGAIAMPSIHALQHTVGLRAAYRDEGVMAAMSGLSLPNEIPSEMAVLGGLDSFDPATTQ